jgi:diacylglycerol kinase (ATP)
MTTKPKRVPRKWKHADAPSSPQLRPKRSIDSFHFALQGVLQGVRAQRHMRFHFVVALLVLLAGSIWGLSRAELLVLMFAIALVIICELFNTAIEAVVDMVTTTYHPLAKYAKDVAAGAVLIAALNAVVVGLLLFVDVERVQALLLRPDEVLPSPVQTVIVTVVLLLVLLVLWKVLGGKGSFLRGGVVSGHSALGFCLCTLILLLTRNPFIAFLAVLMALLILQSRVEAGIHTVREVLIGALLGIVLPVVLFRVLPEILRQLSLRSLVVS